MPRRKLAVAPRTPGIVGYVESLSWVMDELTIFSCDLGQKCKSLSFLEHNVDPVRNFYPGDAFPCD